MFAAESQVSSCVLVVSSAAVVAVVSSAIAEFGKWRERKSRREELALAKAFEIAPAIRNTTIELVKLGKNVQEMTMNDNIATAYVTLRHILEHGKFDPEAQKEVDEEFRQHGIERTGSR